MVFGELESGDFNQIIHFRRFTSPPTRLFTGCMSYVNCCIELGDFEVPCGGSGKLYETECGYEYGEYLLRLLYGYKLYDTAMEYCYEYNKYQKYDTYDTHDTYDTYDTYDKYDKYGLSKRYSSSLDTGLRHGLLLYPSNKKKR